MVSSSNINFYSRFNGISLNNSIIFHPVTFVLAKFVSLHHITMFNFRSHSSSGCTKLLFVDLYLWRFSVQFLLFSFREKRGMTLVKPALCIIYLKSEHMKFSSSTQEAWNMMNRTDLMEYLIHQSYYRWDILGQEGKMIFIRLACQFIGQGKWVGSRLPKQCPPSNFSARLKRGLHGQLLSLFFNFKSVLLLD